jgi:hypothetical protein
MKKYTLARIIDFLFKNILMFFIFFVWLRYYLDSLNLTIFLSASLTVLFGLFLTLRGEKRYNKRVLSKEESNLITACSNEFLFSSFNKNLKFFLNLINQKHTATLKDNFILLKQENFNILVYPFYKTRILNIDDATNIYVNARMQKVDKLIITCKEITQEVLNFTKQLKITKIIVLDERGVYFKLLKKYDTFPKIENKIINEERITFKQISQVAFSKKRTKSYVISGTILLLGSFILKYNLYYIIFSSLLYLMALFSYFNVPFNKRLPENILGK